MNNEEKVYLGYENMAPLKKFEVLEKIFKNQFGIEIFKMDPKNRSSIFYFGQEDENHTVQFYIGADYNIGENICDEKTGKNRSIKSKYYLFFGYPSSDPRKPLNYCAWGDANQFDGLMEDLKERNYSTISFKKSNGKGLYWSKDINDGGDLEEMANVIKADLGLESMRDQLEKQLKAGAKQIIFTGAPGTGKTYTAKKYVEKEYDAYNEEEKLQTEGSPAVDFVQFHSSYDYTDFIEGLRPIQLNDNVSPTFVRMDGVFKAFCRKVVQKNKQLISYNISLSKLPKYYFIIDEINRADLSKVFGEIMYCLEDSYRGAHNRVKTPLHNLKTYDADGNKFERKDDCFADGFYIPENVIILGTMNDIDRSVEAFDFALRRRFIWIEVEANKEARSALLQMLKDNARTLCTNLCAMNDYIAAKDGGGRFGLSKAYQIGHAYVKDYDGNNLENIWEFRIKPILKEYCRGYTDTVKVNKFIETCKEKLQGPSDTAFPQGLSEGQVEE